MCSLRHAKCIKFCHFNKIKGIFNVLNFQYYLSNSNSYYFYINHLTKYNQNNEIIWTTSDIITEENFNKILHAIPDKDGNIFLIWDVQGQSDTIRINRISPDGEFLWESHLTLPDAHTFYFEEAPQINTDNSMSFIYSVGTSYPLQWKLQIVSEDGDLRLQPETSPIFEYNSILYIIPSLNSFYLNCYTSIQV